MGKKIVIIGGVAGGATCAARLRRLDESAEIILLDRGGYISFANCGLPYYIGGAIARRSHLLVMKAEMMAKRFRVDVRVMHEALKIDRNAKTVSIADRRENLVYTERYDKLVLATGSSPFIPDIPGIRGEKIFTVWNMDDVDRIKSYIDDKRPTSAIVAGAGFVGLEMADNLHSLGLRVTIIEKLPQALPNVDLDIAALLHQNIRASGAGLLLNKELISCEESGAGIVARLSGEESLSADMMILSVGVRPNSKLAADAGLSLNTRKGVVVNRNLQTSAPDIYAIGDVAEVEHFVTGGKTMLPLAGPANKQGRVCADNLAGIPSQYKGSMGASIVRAFGWSTASVGLSEKQLQDSGNQIGKDYFVAKTHAFSHATYYPGASRIALKVMYLPDGTVVGAAAAGGEGVDKRIDVIAAAMHFRARIDDLKELELCYSPQFSSAKDPVNMIGFMAENNLNGLCEFITAEELERMQKSCITLLDVREPSELRAGALENSVNIPLAEFRQRLDEIDKTKKIVVYCAIGFRGYIACRILKAYGYDAVNLSGGYATSASLKADAATTDNA